MGRKATGTTHTVDKKLLVRMTPSERRQVHVAAKTLGISQSRLVALASAGLSRRLQGRKPVLIPSAWPGTPDSDDDFTRRERIGFTRVVVLKPYQHPNAAKRAWWSDWLVPMGVQLEPGTDANLYPHDVVAAYLGHRLIYRSYMLGLVTPEGPIAWLPEEWRWKTQNAAFSAQVEFLLSGAALVWEALR